MQGFISKSFIPLAPCQVWEKPQAGERLKSVFIDNSFKVSALDGWHFPGPPIINPLNFWVMFFASKKVFATACNNFRNLWINCTKIDFEKINPYSNYVRLSGKLNGFNYQVNINCPAIADRVPNWCYKRTGQDNDTELIRIFALACACADYGLLFSKYEHLAKQLVLNN